MSENAQWLLISDLLNSGMVSLKKNLNGEADFGAMGTALMNMLEVRQWPLKCLDATGGNKNAKEN